MSTSLPVKRKVAIIGENWGFFEIKDCTDYYSDVLKAEGKEAAEAYFRPGVFTDEEVQALNGEHFLFGYLECLGQSENCPPQLYTCGKKPKYQVEIVVDDFVIPDEIKSVEIVKTVIEMLRSTQVTSQKFLESLEEDIVQNPKVTELFQHYWISNIKLKSATDLLEVSQK